MASLKSRRTCSSRFRAWLSSCTIFSSSSGSWAASAALHNSLQFFRSLSAMLHFLRTFGFDRNVAVALIPGSHFCHEIEDPPLRTHSGAYPDNRSQGRNNRAHDTKTDQYSQSAQIEAAEQL